MSGLFKTPRVQTTQPVDPADLQNRVANQRLAQLDKGGSGSTLLTQAMSSTLGGPRATLTGLG